MGFSIKVNNVDKVIKDLLDEGSEIYSRAKIGVKKGIRLFEADLIKTQMSGRKTAGFGLNRPTGTLARGWNVVTQDTSREYIKTLGTKVKYAKYHQTGVEYQRGNTRVKLRKRLYVHESWKLKGWRSLSQEIARETSKVKK